MPHTDPELMKHATDPEHVNFMVKYTAEIIMSLSALFLGMLQHFKHTKEKAKLAEAVLIDKPVSHAELLECRMNVSETLNQNFKELRLELKKDFTIMHKKFDTHVREFHQK